jgi:hypothetical protein
LGRRSDRRHETKQRKYTAAFQKTKLLHFALRTMLPGFEGQKTEFDLTIGLYSALNKYSETAF